MELPCGVRIRFVDFHLTDKWGKIANFSMCNDTNHSVSVSEEGVEFHIAVKALPALKLLMERVIKRAKGSK